MSAARALDRRPLYLPVREGVTDSISDLLDIAALNLYDTDAKTLKVVLEEWRTSHPWCPGVRDPPRHGSGSREQTRLQ